MHELSIAEALYGTVNDWQRSNGGTVTKVSVAIGRLGGVDAEALKFAWPMVLAAGENAGLANSELELEMLLLSFACRDCSGKVDSEKLMLKCPLCGRESLARHGGRELILKSIEVKEDV